MIPANAKGKCQDISLRSESQDTKHTSCLTKEWLKKNKWNASEWPSQCSGQ